MFPEDRFLEFLIIGALALIVIGPKDLPVLMRRLGRVVGRLRAMAAEFRASFDELARQSELEELRKEVEAMRLNQTGVTSPQMTPFPPSAAPEPSPLPEPAAPAGDTAPATTAGTVEPPTPAKVRSQRKAPTARAGSGSATTGSAPKRARKPKPPPAGSGETA